VNQVENRARSSVRDWRPNVVLINAGTNDANSNFEMDQVGNRMASLINTIVAQVPDAVIVLSTLLPTTNQDAQRRVERINTQYRQLYRNLADAGEQQGSSPRVKIVLADMAAYMNLGDIFDGVHPNVAGEKKMAAVWVWAINHAHSKGWIKAPVDSGRSDDQGQGGVETPVNPGLPSYTPPDDATSYPLPVCPA
jgi:lysophospholipase L1-like esterase